MKIKKESMSSRLRKIISKMEKGDMQYVKGVKSRSTINIAAWRVGKDIRIHKNEDGYTLYHL